MDNIQNSVSVMVDHRLSAVRDWSLHVFQASICIRWSSPQSTTRGREITDILL
jgi:hypothetical protein